MKATLIFLIPFYYKGKTYQINDKIEIEVDNDGTPTDSFWYEQNRFNQGHFIIEFNKKTKGK